MVRTVVYFLNEDSSMEEKVRTRQDDLSGLPFHLMATFVLYFQIVRRGVD
jgi:hypothetical protein